MHVVNVVSSGQLGRELDLPELASALSDLSADAEYHPETFPGLTIRFDSSNYIIVVYSSGSYVIMGASSEEEVTNAYERFLRILDKLDIETKPEEPTVANLICKENLEIEIDLNALVLKLGFENAEYEPETSPFVYYWPDGFDCLITIPSNGEVIVTGVTDESVAERAIDELRGLIDDPSF
ncbi:transcription initiation factor TFIID TATA-box-binding protein [Halalkaliarchaeum desulfuricum]|uniref:Transcription initiation factor TFIID TATA-box-binding protein n=1 Tax=Halalkaliarchaeum desulfuricum TaxID=2055893 RepID=A0A343TIK9_9EURY|nr:hypothetical protein [Halalkaliarchaeum desulfuricum]AUX08931.1 transcription initiation factor TFIID TATA-box-binding protein [Halalkaliarchaeum desulfuricum]